MNQRSGKRKIPFMDIGITDPQPYLKKITEVLQTGKFILGEEVPAFEREFAKYLGAKYAVGVASGTDALLLILRALNIKKDDEIIVPAFTFIASATPIVMLGAKPIFVDIKKDFPVIDEDQIEKVITKKTKAIIAVHLYGYPADVKKIKAIAKKHKLVVIEDASQAHGAGYENKKIGSLGDVSFFSFYPTKNLGAFGDAGAIVTSKKTIYKSVGVLRDHGQVGKYQHEILGYNSRLDTIQAAILRLKLKELDTENNKRNILAKKYLNKLEELPITSFNFYENTKIHPVSYIFAIRSMERDRLAAFLQTKGIVTQIHFPKALPDEKIFLYKSKKSDFPNARLFAQSVLSLPFFVTMTDEQIHFVVESIVEYFSQKGK